jgi:F0F1-type ATP synthase delta subunit
MRPTVSQYAEVLEVLSKEGMNVQDLAKNFLGFLKRRGESDKATVVIEQLGKRSLSQSGILPVTVVTAHELDEATKQALRTQAGQIFPGKTVELRYTVDTSVIGGARFSTPETLYDATVATELGALKKVIINKR